MCLECKKKVMEAVTAIFTDMDINEACGCASVAVVADMDRFTLSVIKQNYASGRDNHAMLLKGLTALIDEIEQEHSTATRQ